MDWCNPNNNFLYGFKNDLMIYDMLVKNLILIKNIKEIKFEKFCMMAFAGFCL